MIGQRKKTSKSTQIKIKNLLTVLKDNKDMMINNKYKLIITGREPFIIKSYLIKY